MLLQQLAATSGLYSFSSAVPYLRTNPVRGSKSCCERPLYFFDKFKSWFRELSVSCYSQRTLWSRRSLPVVLWATLLVRVTCPSHKARGCQVKPRREMLVTTAFQPRMEPEYKMTQEFICEIQYLWNSADLSCAFVGTFLLKVVFWACAWSLIFNLVLNLRLKLSWKLLLSWLQYNAIQEKSQLSACDL